VIYLRETFDAGVSRTHRDELYEIYRQEVLPAASRLHVKLWGSWFIALGTGNWNQMFNIWAFPDWAAWGEFVHKQLNEMQYSDLERRMLKYRRVATTELMMPQPYWKEGELIVGGTHGTGMLYVWESINAEPERWAEYMKGLKEEAIPSSGPRLNWIGSWQTAPGGGRNYQIFNVWSVADWNTWAGNSTVPAEAGNTENERQQNRAIQRNWAAKAMEYRREMSHHLMVPTPLSPFK